MENTTIDPIRFMQHGHLSDLLGSYYLCPVCSIVDKDEGRCIHGYPCPNCDSPSEGGFTFFSLAILTMVDMLEEAYKSIDVDGTLRDPYYSEQINPHCVSVVLLFTTIKEALIDSFLFNIMMTRKYGNALVKRLLTDYNTNYKKYEQLFPAVTGCNWDEALNAIKQKYNRDYTETNSVIKDVSKRRNDFIHERLYFPISYDLAASCINYIILMHQLFIDLHNLFVVKTASSKP